MLRYTVAFIAECCPCFLLADNFFRGFFYYYTANKLPETRWEMSSEGANVTKTITTVSPVPCQHYAEQKVYNTLAISQRVSHTFIGRSESLREFQIIFPSVTRCNFGHFNYIFSSRQRYCVQ